MRNGSSTSKLAVVTTSWDDGHPLDLRLAQMLSDHGMLGTFYVAPWSKSRQVMNKQEIRAVQDLGMEIGAHTLTHAVLTELSPHEAFEEIKGSKEVLEDITGAPIQSFCYPKGRINSMVKSQVIEAGFQLARTVRSFSFDFEFDPFCMPVGFQFFPHSRLINARHAVREANLKGLSNLLRYSNRSGNLLELARSLMEHVERVGGVLHIWGHSWEIEEYGLWGKLEELLVKMASRAGVLYLENSQLLVALRKLRE